MSAWWAPAIDAAVALPVLQAALAPKGGAHPWRPVYRRQLVWAALHLLAACACGLGTLLQGTGEVTAAALAPRLLVCDGLQALLLALLAVLSCLAHLAPPARPRLDGLQIRASAQTAGFVALASCAVLAGSHWLYLLCWQGMGLLATWMVRRAGSHKARAIAVQYGLCQLFSAIVGLLGGMALLAVPGSALSRLLPVDASEAGPMEVACFVALAVAFAARVPLLPLHAWLRDTCAFAPASQVALLVWGGGAVNLWGLWHVAYCGLPRAATMAAPALLTAAGITCVYAAWLAFAQPRVRLALGYVSQAQLACCVLGIVAATPQSVAAAAVVLVLQGTIAGLAWRWVALREWAQAAAGVVPGQPPRSPPAWAFVTLALAAMGAAPLATFAASGWLLRALFQAHGLGISIPEGTMVQFGSLAVGVWGGLFAVRLSWRMVVLEGAIWRSPPGRALRLLACAVGWSIGVGWLAPPIGHYAGGRVARLLAAQAASGAPLTCGLQLAAAVAAISVGMVALALARSCARMRIVAPRGRRRRGAGLRPLLEFLLPVVALMALGFVPWPAADGLLAAAHRRSAAFRLQAGWIAAELDSTSSPENGASARLGATLDAWMPPTSAP